MVHNYRLGLIALFAVLFSVTWMAAVNQPQMAAAAPHESPLPPPESPLPPPESPLPVPSPDSSEGDTGDTAPSVGSTSTGNPAVEIPPADLAGKIVLRFRTQQVNVGWWDACGNLILAPTVGGYADIPVEAMEISIPGDATGQFNLAGWTKSKRADGEWVLRRSHSAPTCDAS